ncbi:hypothetical protein COCON_G00154770 [Conger conger]|uniref:Uncharacterized protein n=1 Tax=Conger conger TaxID=82655 RepID=A0A9Q1HUP5_CONCO|nr:hypothetical protein COCON_G00154770 [Conger conger]
MAWFIGAGLGKTGAGALFGPVGICASICAFAAYQLYQHARQGQEGARRRLIIERQENGDMDSSEVEEFLHLGSADRYKYILKNKRPFTREGYVYHVEADHIPPLQSLHRAREQREFPLLKYKNPNLYRIVMEMKTDPPGQERLTVQVPTDLHRAALSSGNSTASTECRLLLARRIASGETTLMLKQAFIIAHPFSSQQIRRTTGLPGMENKIPQKIELKRDRIVKIYKKAFLTLIRMYCDIEMIIDCKERDDLIEYVEKGMYLNEESEEYKEILDIVRRNSRR